MSGGLKAATGRWSPRSDIGRYHLVRALLSLATFAGVMLLFPGNGPNSLLRMRVGQVSPRKIVAPVSFRVFKSSEQLEAERRAAENAVPAVVSLDSAAADGALGRLAAYASQVRALGRTPGLTTEARAAALQNLGPRLSPASRQVLASPRLAAAVTETARRSLAESYAHGILNGQDLRQVRRAPEAAVLVPGQAERHQPSNRFMDEDDAVSEARVAGGQVWGEGSAAAEAVADVVRAFVSPNAAVDLRELESRRAEAAARVGQFTSSVLQDEKVIDAHERVTEETYLKLRSLDYALSQERPMSAPALAGWWPRLGRALTTLLLLVVFVLYLKLYRPTIYRDTSLLALLAVITLFVLAVASLAVRVFYISEYLIPTAVLPILVTLLFEHQLALFTGLLLCVLVASVADLGLPFVAVSAVSVLASVASVARLQRRSDFYRVMAGVSVAYVLSVTALGLGTQGPGQGLLTDIGWGVMNGVLSTAIAILVLPLLENLFGVTTDVTLLELTDLNRPMLRRLLLEAPGTHHHSVVVSQLADAAAKAIGAKDLLSRVGSLYHDIGKISRAEYFRENQGSSRSPHDKLAPTMSALILASHVKEGLEMARKHGLPRALRPFIAEHHGTGLMAFFYHKALEQEGSADEHLFRYPGPRPRSRETAIVMLADGVEAASRSLVEPTPSRIRGVVTRILDERARDGQLDDCGLTFRDLAQVREAFIPILTAVHHPRISYPVIEPRRREGDAHRDRESLPRSEA
ncbi:MAG: HDIG domain-containing protein [Candidatus Eisenbacteria bacterium]|nr:HDIG domain-containing protein [Candidatus Eisenbacteria bacterium]